MSRPRVYARFVKDLLQRGLLRMSLGAKERVGVFFVKKKGGRLRLILDARRVNEWFRKPPHVALVTSEGLGRIEVTGDELGPETLDLWVGTADVKDAFHRMRMPRWLGDYFGLPPVRAKDLGLREVEGEPVSPDALLTPIPISLPMGFSWSLFLCQDANEEQVGAVLPRCQLLTDHGQPMV